jgi:hypothetical protein
MLIHFYQQCEWTCPVLCDLCWLTDENDNGKTNSPLTTTALKHPSLRSDILIFNHANEHVELFATFAGSPITKATVRQTRREQQ